jgi:molecular chaperone GrpE
MVELLNVIDNFDRALSVETVDNSMKEGMAMILKQLITVLEKSGLEEIIAEGQSFDPNFHHAVQTESSDVHENGHIAKVLQKGYTLNKKVIRPSMVIVAE